MSGTHPARSSTWWFLVLAGGGSLIGLLLGGARAVLMGDLEPLWVGGLVGAGVGASVGLLFAVCVDVEMTW